MAMLSGASKVALLVSIGFLVAFFSLASGLVNAVIEGSNAKQFLIRTRSVQTPGETFAITLILFIGLGGAIFLHRAGKAISPRTQHAMLIGGLGVIGLSMFLGYLLVGLKL
jgi:hypothetical protein